MGPEDEIREEMKLEEEREKLEERLEKKAESSKAFRVTVAAAAIVIGLLLAAYPLTSGMIAVYLMLAGLALTAVYEIVVYFKTPMPQKNDMSLNRGVLMLVLTVFVLFLTFGSPDAQLIWLPLLAVVFGCIALAHGITKLLSRNYMKAVSESLSKWMLISGITDLCVAALMLVMPLLGIWTANLVLGIYLIYRGILLLLDKRKDG